MQRLLLATTLLCAVACAATPRTGTLGTLVDLTHSFDADTIYWPTEEGFVLETEFEGFTPGGYFYEAKRFRAAEHGGTHLDAPVHFSQGGQSVEQIPLERFFGEAYVVDVVEQSNQDPDHQVSLDDIRRAEEAQGPIPADAIVLLRSGFSRRWPDATRYLGTTERGDGAVRQLHFPGLHPDAARWLVANRTIKAIGIDTASIDYGQSMLFESHRVLYERNIPAFENLTALEQLPARGAYIVALPMKIGGGSGAPLRAVAIVPSAP
jgi:kynurenine formamidase